MKNYNVIIVGGGVSGLSCALHIASAKKSKDWAKDKSILVVDAGKSDLNKAQLFNAPGITSGLTGTELLANLRKQVESYGGVDFSEDEVKDVQGEHGDFTVSFANGESNKSELVVIATGFNAMTIASLADKTSVNANAPRAGKVQLQIDSENQIKKGLFAAGAVSGASSMFASAAGSGVQVSCNIFKLWNGSPAYVHDVPKK